MQLCKPCHVQRLVFVPVRAVHDFEIGISIHARQIWSGPDQAVHTILRTAGLPGARVPCGHGGDEELSFNQVMLSHSARLLTLRAGFQGT